MKIIFVLAAVITITACNSNKEEKGVNQKEAETAAEKKAFSL
jgi:hypothetical protein